MKEQWLIIRMVSGEVCEVRADSYTIDDEGFDIRVERDGETVCTVSITEVSCVYWADKQPVLQCPNPDADCMNCEKSCYRAAGGAKCL